MQGAVVTGSTGFLGKYLINLLLKKGYKVFSISRRTLVQDSESFCHISVDINDLEIDNNIISQKVRVHLTNCDRIVVFHLAWSGNGKLSDLDVNAQLKNIVGLQNALEVTRLIGASTFVFAGSMEESFASSYQSYFLDNSKYLYNRHIVYATVKQMAREYLELFTKESKFSIKIFTNSHLMGIGDDKDSFLQFLLEQMITKPETTINTSSGEQLFDVISVKDAARAYEFLWQIKEPDNSIINYCIGSSAPRSLKEYVIEAANICEFSLENIRFGELDFNDVSLSKDVFLPSLASQRFVYNYDFSLIVKEMKAHFLTNQNWNQ